jgi:hypothetical protein
MRSPKNRFLRIGLLGFLTVLSVPTLIAGDAFGNVRLAFDSTSLDFGNLALLGSRELALEVWDTATVDIEIDKLSIAGSAIGDFSIVSPTQFPVVLTPGALPTQIILKFKPSVVGNRSAQLAIETTDGLVTIPLSGYGIAGATLSWSVPSIAFGIIPPGITLDTIIELYSEGTDTSEIDELLVASSDNSFTAQFANGITPPIFLAPGDSVAVQIDFQGLSLEGTKDASLTAIGTMLNSPTCNLSGDVELGSFEILPSPTFDFGVMYIGQVLDSEIKLVNTGNVSLVFENLNLSPSGEDFTILNPPQLPFTLGAGDTLSIPVEVNPGISTGHRAQLQVVSQQALPNFIPDNLVVSVTKPPISEPSAQTLSYYCATRVPVRDTIPVINSGSQSVVLSSVESSDSSISLQSSVSFPDTILAGATQPIVIQFVPSASSTDTLVLSMLGGTQVMVSDSLMLQPLPTKANTGIIGAAAVGSTNQHIEVSTVIGLASFGLDSVIVHVAVEDQNVATIDPSTILLAPGIANATIASIRPEPGGYAVTITSTSPLMIPAGNSIVVMNLNRYVSNSDSTTFTAIIETPALDGCLDWTGDTITLNGPMICGSATLQAFLSQSPLNIVASLLENPVSGQRADLSITSGQTCDVHYELINALGEIRSEGSLHLASGSNECNISVSGFPSGIYTFRLISDQGPTVTLRLVKID